MDLSHDKFLRSPGQYDGEEERSTPAQMVQEPAIPYTTILEHMPDAFLALDMQGRITYLNHQAETFLRKTRAELLGRSIWEIWPKVRDTPLFQYCRQARTTGKAASFEYRSYSGNKWFHVHISPLEAGVCVYFQDITERKQLEREAAKAKEQLETILHNVADGILVVDANNSLVYVNDVAAYMYGFPSATDLLAAPPFAFDQMLRKFTTWDEQGRPLPFAERPTVQALQGKKAQRLVLFQHMVTGHKYWLLVRAQPILDAQGQVQFVVSVLTDLTEQKEFEQRKDHFISMASHELKTPLTILSTFTQLLRERFETEHRQDVTLHLSKMDDQVTRLNKLVAELLDISKMQAGKLELAQEAVDMDELVRELVENLQPTTTHHLLIEGEAQQTITGDRDRLGQVLMNLLTNAIKYSPLVGGQGEPKSETVVVRVAQTRDTLVVSVQDFGIGIPRGHQEKLFERFYRVYSEKDQTYPGLGIGLYIAHEIIQRHGGKIWVDSVEGKGSTFSFSLPIR